MPRSRVRPARRKKRQPKAQQQTGLITYEVVLTLPNGESSVRTASGRTPVDAVNQARTDFVEEMRKVVLAAPARYRIKEQRPALKTVTPHDLAVEMGIEATPQQEQIMDAVMAGESVEIRSGRKGPTLSSSRRTPADIALAPMPPKGAEGTAYEPDDQVKIIWLTAREEQGDSPARKESASHVMQAPRSPDLTWCGARQQFRHTERVGAYSEVTCPKCLSAVAKNAPKAWR